MPEDDTSGTRGAFSGPAKIGGNYYIVSNIEKARHTGSKHHNSISRTAPAANIVI